MTLEGRVRQKLESRPELRADDKKLIVAVWEDLGLHLTPEQQKKLFAVYAPESIRRVRQKLNERGIGLPDIRTQKKRKVLAEQMRQEVREDKAPILFSLAPQHKSVDPFKNS